MANKLSITHGPNLTKPCFVVSGGEERVSIHYYKPEKAKELWPEVGDGVKWNRRRIVGVFEPPLLHRRSDTPCPTIASSS